MAERERVNNISLEEGVRIYIPEDLSDQIEQGVYIVGEEIKHE